MKSIDSNYSIYQKPMYKSQLSLIFTDVRFFHLCRCSSRHHPEQQPKTLSYFLIFKRRRQQLIVTLFAVPLSSGGNVEEGERNGISTSSVRRSTNLLFFFHRTSRNKLTPKCVVVDKKENVRKKAILVAVPAAPIAVVFPSKTTIDLQRTVSEYQKYSGGKRGKEGYESKKTALVNWPCFMVYHNTHPTQRSIQCQFLRSCQPTTTTQTLLLHF